MICRIEIRQSGDNKCVCLCLRVCLCETLQHCEGVAISRDNLRLRKFVSSTQKCAKKFALKKKKRNMHFTNQLQGLRFSIFAASRFPSCVRKVFYD